MAAANEISVVAAKSTASSELMTVPLLLFSLKEEQKYRTESFSRWTTLFRFTLDWLLQEFCETPWCWVNKSWPSESDTLIHWFALSPSNFCLYKCFLWVLYRMDAWDKSKGFVPSYIYVWWWCPSWLRSLIDVQSRWFHFSWFSSTVFWHLLHLIMTGTCSSTSSDVILFFLNKFIFLGVQDLKWKKNYISTCVCKEVTK